MRRGSMNRRDLVPLVVAQQHDGLFQHGRARQRAGPSDGKLSGDNSPCERVVIHPDCQAQHEGKIVRLPVSGRTHGLETPLTRHDGDVRDRTV